MANIHWKPKLTEKQVRTLPAGRYTDGQGLMLFVQPSGSRQWVQRIVIRGKRVDIGLGGYPLVSMTEAREQAFENRRIARKGGDPRVKQEPVPTFAEAARMVHEQHANHKNERDRARWLTEIANHVFPTIGNHPIDQITTNDMLNVFEPIWNTTPTVAKRVRQRVSLIFQWSIVKNFRNDDPAFAISAFLGKGNGHVVKHHESVKHGEVADAIAKIRASKQSASVRLAFEFLILTAVRSNEVRHAEWKEIDLEARTWTIPDEKIKMGKEHRVPLSDRAMEILEQAREIKTNGVVFANRAGNAIDEKKLADTARKLALGGTPHGFRSSFRTWCQDTGVPNDVSEAALAHKEENQVKQAYGRSDFFDARVKVMDDWANYLTG